MRRAERLQPGCFATWLLKSRHRLHAKRSQPGLSSGALLRKTATRLLRNLVAEVSTPPACEEVAAGAQLGRTAPKDCNQVGNQPGCSSRFRQPPAVGVVD